MKIFGNLFFVAVFVFLAGCSMNKAQIDQYTLPPAVPGGTQYGGDVDNVSETEDTVYLDAITGATKTEIVFAILAGPSYGGIVDNRDASGIAVPSDVDAITGATKLAYSAGIHTILKGYGIAVEVGLDYIKFDQSVEYNMPSISVNGTRRFEFQQIRLPMLYNFEYFKNHLNKAKFVSKLGVSVGYTFNKTITDSEDSENMPAYEFFDWEVGPAFGIFYYPFEFSQSYRLGFYIDFYRGIKIYEDVYHEGIFLGDNTFLRFGVIFEP